jgi:hypothetical protein
VVSLAAIFGYMLGCCLTVDTGRALRLEDGQFASSAQATQAAGEGGGEPVSGLPASWRCDP